MKRSADQSGVSCCQLRACRIRFLALASGTCFWCSAGADIHHNCSSGASTEYARARRLALTGGQFSVVVVLGSPLADGWLEASIHELIDGAPGSEVLDSASELVILEGPREVARQGDFHADSTAGAWFVEGGKESVDRKDCVGGNLDSARTPVALGFSLRGDADSSPAELLETTI
jgi:hypothetical protein